MKDEIQPSPTIEEYLETILNLLSEGKSVVGARLAERLQVSPPTVTVTIQRMARHGLLTITKHKEITLTEQGMKDAISIVKRHRLAERLLTDILKVPWSEVHQEACRLEHGISDGVMNRLYQVLGEPKTCPHGNPIPVDDVPPPLRGTPLDTIATGQKVIVERISEEANRQEELMQYLDQAGIKPGATIDVKETALYAGTIQITINNNDFSLGTKAAAMVWVVPESSSQS
ncbi:MAG: metal-dependent transcriptional regulator [Dehalococcoidales bacterium]|nr:metal-dependent transcriptional regulator [Dehalococcoidales bacterium]